MTICRWYVRHCNQMTSLYQMIKNKRFIKGDFLKTYNGNKSLKNMDTLIDSLIDCELVQQLIRNGKVSRDTLNHFKSNLNSRLNRYHEIDRTYGRTNPFYGSQLEHTWINMVEDFVAKIVNSFQTKVEPNSVVDAMTQMAGFVGESTNDQENGYDFVHKCANGAVGRIKSMAQSLRTLESDPLKNTLNEFRQSCIRSAIDTTISGSESSMAANVQSSLSNILGTEKIPNAPSQDQGTINSVLKQFATKYKPSEVYKKAYQHYSDLIGNYNRKDAESHFANNTTELCRIFYELKLIDSQNDEEELTQKYRINGDPEQPLIWNRVQNELPVAILKHLETLGILQFTENKNNRNITAITTPNGEVISTQQTTDQQPRVLRSNPNQRQVVSSDQFNAVHQHIQTSHGGG